MEDKLLIDGLFARDERIVARLEEKYSGYCYTCLLYTSDAADD